MIRFVKAKYDVPGDLNILILEQGTATGLVAKTTRI